MLTSGSPRGHDGPAAPVPAIGAAGPFSFMRASYQRICSCGSFSRADRAATRVGRPGFDSVPTGEGGAASPAPRTRPSPERFEDRTLLSSMFQPASGAPFAAGHNPAGVVAADLNGDGIADLAVANNTDNNVTVLLGAGDGSFTPATGSPVAVGTEPEGLVAADLDGDGKTDLARPTAQTTT